MMPAFASMRVQMPRVMKFHVKSSRFRNELDTAVARMIEVIVTLARKISKLPVLQDHRSYKPPIRKMTHSMSLSRGFNCRLKIGGIGSARTITSVKIFTTLYAIQKTSESMQRASIDLSHDPCIGMHWNIVAPVAPMLHATMMAMTV